MLAAAIAESLAVSQAESGGAAATEDSSFGDAPEARSLGARAPSPPAAPVFSSTQTRTLLTLTLIS